MLTTDLHINSELNFCKAPLSFGLQNKNAPEPKPQGIFLTQHQLAPKRRTTRSRLLLRITNRTSLLVFIRQIPDIHAENLIMLRAQQLLPRSIKVLRNILG